MHLLNTGRLCKKNTTREWAIWWFFFSLIEKTQKSTGDENPDWVRG